MSKSPRKNIRLGRTSPFIRELVCHFPPHQTFCEVFGGDVAVFLAKPPANVDVYNDNDKELVNLFRVIRDKKLFAALQSALDNTLYSRDEFELAHELCSDKVERARRFVVRHWQGEAGVWRFSVDRANRGRASAVAQWDGALKGLVSIHRRMRGVQVERDRWDAVLKRYDKPSTLFFIDHPYTVEEGEASTLDGIRSQEQESFLQRYDRLVEAVQSAKGMVVFRSYGFEPELRLQEAGWHKRTVANDTGLGLWLCPKAVLSHTQPDNPQRSLFT